MPAVCRFKCKPEFYQKSGQTVISCMESGKWNGTSVECEG